MKQLNLSEIIKSNNLVLKWYVLGAISPKITLKDNIIHLKITSKIQESILNNGLLDDQTVTDWNKLIRNVYSSLFSFSDKNILDDKKQAGKVGTVIHILDDINIFKATKPNKESASNLYDLIIQQYFNDKKDSNIIISNFFLGMCDSRGSMDLVGNFMAVDTTKAYVSDFMIFIKKFTNVTAENELNNNSKLILSSIKNINTRITQPSKTSRSKEVQLRFDLKLYLSTVGLCSPFKIELFHFKLKNKNDGFLKYYLNNESTHNNITFWEFADNEVLSLNKFNSEFIKKIELTYADENNKNFNTKFDKESYEVIKQIEKINEINNKKIYFRKSWSDNAVYDLIKKHSKKCFYKDCKSVVSVKSNGMPRLELNHCIPFRHKNYFLKNHNIDIDVLENLLPLCGNCHRAITYDKDKYSLDVLEKIFKYYQDYWWPSINIKISLKDFVALY